ncbi:MAG: hypothetical protein Q8J74_07085 [Candidatus Didemnitutus sp.]|nr:hypothetical protein [Candidatus Didemnitutus sp.]
MPNVRRLTFQKERAVELRTRDFRLVAVTSNGPRIAFFGRPDGENLFHWAPGQHRRGQWDLQGGHRLWTTRPGADESEETYHADSGACTVEVAGRGFTVTAPVDAATRLQRGFRVRAPVANRVTVEHFVCNTGPMLWSGGLWALTCTAPRAATTYSAPLGDGSAWDYSTVVAFRTWGGGHGGVGFEDPQFSTARDQFVLRPSGRENKRMLKADAGIMAMHDPERGTLFVKHAAYEPGSAYPLGTNLAFYVGPENFMVEMETMGPAVTLKPGATLHHTETWFLTSAGARPPSSTALRKLVS